MPLTSDLSFLGTNLVKKAIYAMVEGDCDEVSCRGPVSSRGVYRLWFCVAVGRKSETLVNMAVPTCEGEL